MDTTPLTPAKLQELRELHREYCCNGRGLEDKQLDVVMIALPKLLAMVEGDHIGDANKKVKE